MVKTLCFETVLCASSQHRRVLGAKHASNPEYKLNSLFFLPFLGPRYLAAPVLQQGATTRTLYLPENEGGWTHYYTRKVYTGGVNVTVPAPFDELPLFARAG